MPVSQSRAPRLFLTEDSTTEPRKPELATMIDIRVDCHQRYGVIHHSAVPSRPATVAATITPAHVLSGSDFSGVPPSTALVITSVRSAM